MLDAWVLFAPPGPSIIRFATHTPIKVNGYHGHKYFKAYTSSKSYQDLDHLSGGFRFWAVGEAVESLLYWVYKLWVV